VANQVTQIKIARSFGAASKSYDVSARLQRYSGKHLLPWLPNRNDLTVIDLGAGTGFFTDILASKFEQVIGVDLSSQMLNFAKNTRNKNIKWVNANASNLPFQDNSVDLIYSNLMIQWCQPLETVIEEILRVLKPGGLFVFTTLTDGTLYELKSSWAQVDNDKHVINFLDVDVLESCFPTGSSLLLEKTSQNIILEYENVLHLAHELKGLGANHVPNKKGKGLAGKDKWNQMSQAYQDFQEPGGIYPATYCVYSGLLVKLNED
jgi:malonyl-CoA O-methyltransferase